MSETAEFPEPPHTKAPERFSAEITQDEPEFREIFAVRGTDQPRIQYALGLPDNLTEFARSQFSLFQRIIEQMKPQAIVVPNAGASHVLCHQMELGEMCADDSCHSLNLNGRRVPVFLSGMLSGQRAIDAHSRERLAYPVRKAMSAATSRLPAPQRKR